MPIVRCFETAAGGGGGTSLNGITMEGPIDLTSADWTLYDPDSLIDGVTFDGTHNTITWNALAVGSNDYVWTASTTHRAPRWYKALEIDGTRITSDDLIDAVIWISNDNTVRDFANKVVVGPCADPTSTVATTIAGMGANATALVAGSLTDYGVWTVNGQATGNNANAVASLATAQYGALHTGAAVYTVLDSSDQRVQSGSRSQNTAVSTGIDLFWVVGAGARSNTITWLDGVTNRFSAYILASKPTLP